MNRAQRAFLILALAFAIVGAFFGVKIHAELARGDQVFWLAELWPPAAICTIVLVVCIDMGGSRARKGPEEAA